MHLIFIYGPPASGKLTIAKELYKKLNYRVYHNHEIIDHLARLFPYDDKILSVNRRKLANDVRLNIFSEAAKAKVDFVTTFGMSGSKYFNFFRNVADAIEENAGTVNFVQLIPSKKALMTRVQSESRKGIKIDNPACLANLIKENPELFHKFPGVEHLSLDNTHLSASKAADAIIEYYQLK